MIEDTTLGTIVGAVASGDPTPGGGYVSALSGSLGASLYLMVINLTLPKKESPLFEERRSRLQEMQALFLRLAERDSAAYGEVLNALAMPKGEEHEKARRRAALEEATIGAALVPLETARACLEVMRLGPDLVEWGKKSCLSDTAVGFFMAHAGFRGAVMNVEINLASLKREEARRELSEALEPMRREAAALYERVSALTAR